MTPDQTKRAELERLELCQALEEILKTEPDVARRRVAQERYVAITTSECRK